MEVDEQFLHPDFDLGDLYERMSDIYCAKNQFDNLSVASFDAKSEAACFSLSPEKQTDKVEKMSESDSVESENNQIQPIK